MTSYPLDVIRPSAFRGFRLPSFREALMLRWVPGGPVKTPLLPESETSFFMTAQSAVYEFVKDDNGEAKYLFRYTGGAPRQWIRK